MQLEHANINVPSIAEATAFLKAAFPEIVVRGEGDVFNRPELGRWIHLGNNETYIALQETGDAKLGSYGGVNHLGFAVSSVAEVMSRLQSAGYVPTDDEELDTHPYRRRVYYQDGNGFNWEFVEYLSERVEERNQY